MPKHGGGDRDRLGYWMTPDPYSSPAMGEFINRISAWMVLRSDLIAEFFGTTEFLCSYSALIFHAAKKFHDQSPAFEIWLPPNVARAAGADLIGGLVADRIEKLVSAEAARGRG